MWAFPHSLNKLTEINRRWIKELTIYHVKNEQVLFQTPVSRFFIQGGKNVYDTRHLIQNVMIYCRVDCMAPSYEAVKHGRDSSRTWNQWLLWYRLLAIYQARCNVLYFSLIKR
jgi:hypothetical protein